MLDQQVLQKRMKQRQVFVEARSEKKNRKGFLIRGIKSSVGEILYQCN
jgi:hypothetical protein